MAAPRFQSRLALLDLELRRLLRQPWFPLATLMLVPLPLVLSLAPFAGQTAPGLDLFRVAAWCWCTAGMVLLAPLTGLAFRGEHRQDELESLSVTGYSAYALAAGMIGSRLVMALAILMLPVPLLLLCYALGGVTAVGLLAACLHITAFFLAFAAWHSLLGVVLRSDLAHGIFAFLSVVFVFVLDAIGSRLGPYSYAMERVSSVGASGLGSMGTSLLVFLAILLFSLVLLVLRQRILRGFAATVERVPSRRVKTAAADRPPVGAGAIPWKESRFTLGGLAGRRVAVWWSAVAFPAAFLITAWSTWPQKPGEEDFFLGCLAVMILATVLSMMGSLHSLVSLFVRELRAGTFDDLILARGAAGPVVLEKILAWRRRSRESSVAFVASSLCWGVLWLVVTLATDAPESIDALLTMAAVLLWSFSLRMLQDYYAAKMLKDWTRTGTHNLITLARRLFGFCAEWGANLFLFAFIIAGSVAIGSDPDRCAPILLITTTLMLLLHQHYSQRGLQQIRECTLAFCGDSGELRDDPDWILYVDEKERFRHRPLEARAARSVPEKGTGVTPSPG